MKTMSKIYAVLLTVLLVSAAAVGAASANDTLEPWEEVFLEEYGEYRMYEDYGSQWFEYFLYEGDDEERYNELLAMYEELKVQNTPDSELAPWEEVFLEEYGDYWMYENYGSHWFEYYLYQGDEEWYNELLAMYEELEAQNAEETPVTEQENPVLNLTNTSTLNTTNTSVLNLTNTSTLNTTNTSALNLTNTSTLNTTNTSALNLTNTSILNTTNTSVLNETLYPTQNTTNSSALNTTVPEEPKSEFPVVPVVIGCVVAVILIAGIAVVLVKRKGTTNTNHNTPSEENTEDKPEEQKDTVSPEPAVPETAETAPAAEPKAPVSLTTPKECYAAVSAEIAEKYNVEHVSSLTPRQLLTFGEPTAELKEFVRIYEQVRYAPKTEAEDTAKLAELARVILKQ